ncbi:MAG: hypothetical protein ACRECQ_04180, partial [Burkholderiaceae bacterium]
MCNQSIKYLWLVPLLIALPVAATEFGQRHPAGSIRDPAAAQMALKEADAEIARIAGEAKA